MTKKDRIDAISKIVQSFDLMNLHEIDLILETYEFEMTKPLLGSGLDYSDAIYSLLKKESDAKILELYNHFISPEQTESQPIVTERKGNIKIFISHLSKNKDFAELLKLELDEYNIECFVAHSDITPSKEWQVEIENYLINCDALIALINTEFCTSLWTDQEIGFAYALRKFIIPVRLGADPYGFIGKFQGLYGLNKSAEQISKEIVELVSSQEALYTRLGSFLVDKFSKAYSWAEANKYMDKIENLKKIAEADIEKFKLACETNDQIYNSHKISETRIAQFIKKFETS